MGGRRHGLIRARKAAIYTQESLAHALDMDMKTVGTWERGEAEPVPYKRPKLAKLLGISLAKLEELLAEGTAGVPAEPAPADEPAAPSPAPSPAPRGGLLLPVIVDGRPVLMPLDGATAATSGLGSLLPPALVAGDEANLPAAQAAEWDAMSPLSRRSLLTNGFAAAALPALGLDDLHRVAEAMADARRYFDGPVLDYFSRQLDICKSDDGTLGPAKTLPLVLGVVGAIEEHARDVKPSIRRDLLRLGAESAEFAGWLYRDVRDFGRTLYWYDRAMEWAQEANDPAMQGYVLLKKAQLAFDQREPQRMLTLAQAVQHGPWSLPNRVQAESVQQEARAEVMLGATADAVAPKLDQARQLLGARDDGASTLGAHYNDTLLTMQTAICYTEAGAPRRAVELYDESLVEDRFSPRDYGFFLSLRAGSLALAGEPDEAARTGVESAARADSTSSRRTKQELVRVLEHLRPWTNRPAVTQLREVVAS
ncbi:XRE family transcriptional regulator [Amycolatopsis mediterranei S699]|uniref:XRE family transcriptional regulator n=3 Tax=Amycolatopsis mediterranei TaxID=33910 RepID=A0A0H3D318_AMYMU|nr:XRE family transcriptional regulator [Amycolatopsis mediterranei U32]AEK40661.1 XRE family transcriptional regulator [Amycolatopsis mediterranei S699]AGT82778.1 XRE family transcriptional regulator [Amycolatopsis mediterranei RB]KDO04266.1 XRE family transcriptional regulator [Amycolatopsis mediterranei]AFO75649.1 XRE family transcriptional regulator [Amycolatopsis mediterranei S699]